MAAAVAREGESAFVARCVAFLDGSSPDPALIEVIGGAGVGYVMSGHEGGPGGYWPRTWVLRALLYAWDTSAEDAVIDACGDHAWRVREMAAKVLARHKVASREARAAMLNMIHDENARAAKAAMRAWDVSAGRS